MATITDAAWQDFKHQALPRLEELNPTMLEIIYDHQVDTLFVHLFGHDRRATNRLAGEYAYYRVDPRTQEVVGLQIESFLRRAVNDQPDLIGLLRFAELRGVSFDQVQRESTQAFPAPLRWLHRIRTGLAFMVPSFTEQATQQAMAALQLYLSHESNDAEVGEEMNP